MSETLLGACFCGGHVFTDHPGMGLIDVYLNAVPGKDHQGAMHVY
jgi:hypothetical protein